MSFQNFISKKLTEAQRSILISDDGRLKYSIVKNYDTGEWMAKAYLDGKYNEAKTIYTDDKLDALGSAQFDINNWNKLTDEIKNKSSIDSIKFSKEIEDEHQANLKSIMNRRESITFKNFIKEKEEKKIFPSDDKIKNAVKDAGAAFWKSILSDEDFKLFIESENISPEISDKLNQSQFEAVKEWLTKNKPNDILNSDDNDNDNPNTGFKGGVRSFEPDSPSSVNSDVGGSNVRM